MLRRTPTAVRTWADEIGIPNQLLAELDFCLVHMIQAITTDAVLADRLYLKGGTALNKLYFMDLSRLSVDIDLNHIGPKDKVLGERKNVTSRLMEVIQRQDNSYVVKVTKRRYEQTTIRVTYPSIAGMPDQHTKIEISHVERFPILPTLRRQLSLPGEGEASLTSYKPEELIATKIRAFHDRLKGRDVYDLWCSIGKLKLDKSVIRKLFLYYFYRSRKVFNPKLFYTRLEKAAKENAIADDVSSFVRSDAEFNLREGTNKVLKWLGFLGDLDDADQDFIMLARALLRRGEIPKKKRKEISSIIYPLGHLFGKDYNITEQARGKTTNDIMLFVGKK